MESMRKATRLVMKSLLVIYRNITAKRGGSFINIFTQRCKGLPPMR
jgi:hypothetical protein